MLAKVLARGGSVGHAVSDLHRRLRGAGWPLILTREESDCSADTSSTTSHTSDCSDAAEGVADVTAGTDAEEVTADEYRPPQVQFTNVSIRTYSLTVGDTFVAKPYTLMLDWEHTPTVTMDIESFEQQVSVERANALRRYNRGFALPLFLPMEQRFDRLAAVTGLSPAQLYRLESKRLERESAIPLGMCSSDEGYDDLFDESRNKPYQFVDVDDYQLAEV